MTTIQLSNCQSLQPISNPIFQFMKMKYLILIVLVSLFSCSKDDTSSTKASVNKITPANTFIGDTVTLTGTNLNNLTRISLVNEEPAEKSSQVLNDNDFLSKTDTEIKFIVPEMYHENVTVYTTTDSPGIQINLYGFIPYSYINNGSIYRYAEVKQLLSDDIALLESNQFFIERFKMTNNLTDYNPLPSRNTNDHNYYYTSEDSGYILAEGANVWYNIYSFEDHINNRSLEYGITYEDLNGKEISHIEYVSNSSAYVMNRIGEMFRVSDGQITSFSDLYPALENTPYMTDDYMKYTYSFQVLEDNSIIISPWYQNYILRFNATDVEVIYFDDSPSQSHEHGRNEPVFFGNTGAFYSNQKIFKSNDYGLTWNEYDVDVTMDEYDGIQYLGGSQFSLHDGSYRNDSSIRPKYLSTDNGATWKLIYNSYDAIRDLKMSDHYGLATSEQHGLFKFIKFPQ